MKATAAAVLTFIFMFVFSHRAIVRSLGGSAKMWALLLIDLLAAAAVFALVNWW